MINEFHFSLTKALQLGQELLFWQLEYRYPYGQADSLYTVKTGPSGGILFFLEADDGANSFDAVFPIVLVVTPRKKEIERLAAAANKTVWKAVSPEEVNSFVLEITGS